MNNGEAIADKLKRKHYGIVSIYLKCPYRFLEDTEKKKQCRKMNYTCLPCKIGWLNDDADSDLIY
jgi:hypothetical protein